MEGSNPRLSLHWTSLAEGNVNFSIVLVFRCADDLTVGFGHRESAPQLGRTSDTGARRRLPAIVRSRAASFVEIVPAKPNAIPGSA